ncbi:MAG: SH3 domain-containing protein [Fibrobacterales bacterium]
MKKRYLTLLIALLVMSTTISSNLARRSKKQEPLKGTFLVIIDSQATLRSAPTQHASLIDQAPFGETISLISMHNDWYLISYNGSQGYIYKTAATTPDHFAKIKQLVHPTNSEGRVNAIYIKPKNGAILRTEPKAGATPIKAFPNGTRLLKIKKVNDWFHAKANGYEGYIHQTVVSSIKPKS